MVSYSQKLYMVIKNVYLTNSCAFIAIQNSLTCMRNFVNAAGLTYLDICQSSSGFLLSLVNDTLDFAQLQAGKFKMNFEPIEVSNLVNEVYSLINVQLRLKTNVFLVKSVAKHVPLVIESDYQRLKQILINILRNSTKFTFKGYI